jgi:tetratricopeptide (TPR) repeat protein
MIKTSATARVVVLCLAILGSTGGCIYFNLMYNAETAFDTARNAHRKLVKDNPDSTIVPPADVDNGYKKAIDKCNKVFEIYPKKKKWHDQALYLMGKAYYFDCDYDHTIHTFRQLQERFPASPFIGESYLYTGRAYLKKEDLDKAEEIFNAVIEKYPALNKNEEVTLLLAEIAIHREGKSQAIELLQKTYKSVKTPERKVEVALKIAQLYYDMKLYDKAIEVLEAAPRPKDLREQLFRIDFLRVSCYVEKGNLSRGLDLIIGMLELKPYVSHVPYMLLCKGGILDKLNRIDEAMAVFREIKDIYPSSDFVGNAWFELGRVNQYRKGDLAKAKECYDMAAGALKDPLLKDLAVQRSKAMDTIIKMRSGKAVKDTVKADTVTPPDYKIGELFWLELDQPDSAFAWYCASARDTLHKAQIPKALYSAVWIARFALRDSVKADSLYNVLLKKFPANAFSRKAQEAKGGPVTIMTRQDSALDAFHGAERLYWEDNNPDSAAEAYVQVYDAFSETDCGPKSLYAAAWIYDFVLDKNRSAKKLYELLCDSFPKSPYSLEAKPRLKTVSDTLAALKAHKKLPQRDLGAATTAPVKSIAATAAKNSDSPHSATRDTSQQKSVDIISDRTRDTTQKKQQPSLTSPQPVIQSKTMPLPMPQSPAPQPAAAAQLAAPDTTKKLQQALTPRQPTSTPKSDSLGGPTVAPASIVHTPNLGKMSPGPAPRDSAITRTVPGAKPDSILNPGPVKAVDTIGLSE